MKTYNNINIENADKMEYSALLDAVKSELEKEGIVGESATIIADLMVRFDEDVVEQNGQFYTESSKVIYTVRVRDDYDENKGDAPFCESYQFDTFEDAEVRFSSELNFRTSECGITREVSFYKGTGADPFDECIQSDTCFSEELPENAVLVFYHHVRYMGYAYAIEKVCSSSNLGKKCYSDLGYNKDRVFSTWCEVYASGEELREDFVNGRGIFDKLNSGGRKVEDWLSENGFEVGEQELFYDVIIENKRIKKLEVVGENDYATDDASFRIRCSWDAKDVSKKSVHDIVLMNLSMGHEASGSVRDGSWHSVNVEVIAEFEN